MSEPITTAPMTTEQFRAYQRELGDLTHSATGTLLGLSEIAVKRYATSRPVPPTVAVALRAIVLLDRLRKLNMLSEMP